MLPQQLRHQLNRFYGVSAGEANRLRGRIGELEATLERITLLAAEERATAASARATVLAELDAASAERAALAERVGAAEAGEREWVPTGHYYSAVPSKDHLAKHRSRITGADPSVLPGVDLRLAQQEALLDELEKLQAGISFPEDPAEGYRYHFDNEMYAYTDGLFLSLMAQHLRPRRVIEIGSGYSSACLLDTADRFPPGPTSFTFVEPYPERLLSLLGPDEVANVEIIEDEVQSVPLARFAELEAGDLLLIDSTHTVKAGGDVNHLFFDVLPVLRSGVIVHVHDIQPGFEYLWMWLEQGRAWAEAYLLRAFLQYNDTFEILLWPSLMASRDPAGWEKRFRFGPDRTGGAIYLRRR